MTTEGNTGLVGSVYYSALLLHQDTAEIGPIKKESRFWQGYREAPIIRRWTGASVWAADPSVDASVASATGNYATWSS